ncbi:23266_t:CDS:2, partial [Gigaspora margarita]
NQTVSQIDDIWISAEVIYEFTKPELWEADKITDRIENRRNNERMKIKQSLACMELDNKTINGIYRFCKKLPIPLSYEECTMQINKELKYVKQETEYEIPILEQQIDELRKALHKAREVENQKEKKERIQSHVIRRRKKFTDNTKRMIKSVLKCKVVSVILNNLKQKDLIITDVRRIKKEVEEHFSKWTNMNQPAHQYGKIG